MKKITIALALLGFTWTSAQGQTNKCVCQHANKLAVHKKTAHAVLHHNDMTATSSTYQVCREEGGYYVCCLHKGTAVQPLTVQPVAAPGKPLANK